VNCISSAAKIAAAALAITFAAVPVAAADEPDKSTLDQIKDSLAELQKLKASQPKTVEPSTLAIESWLLTSTAIDATGARIHDAVATDVASHPLIILAGNETLEASQVGMMRTEMTALSTRLKRASAISCEQRTEEMAFVGLPAAISAASALVDLLKTETDLTAISQTVPAGLVAAAVANRFPKDAILPTAAIAAGPEGPLLKQFRELADTAATAQKSHDDLDGDAAQSDCEKNKFKALTAALAPFDAFYARVTTAKDGAVPIVVADRLDRMLQKDALVLRVNTEAAGGTLLRRTNLLTALGAETAFISGGLVSSYQLTDPQTGRLYRAGVVTCRTTLTSLKKVQDGTWGTRSGRDWAATATCYPLAPAS
jgi:hypothetical protein